jgi:hypothetical protein
MINSFSKVADTKISLQKSGKFLYTKNKQIEKKNIPFGIA